MDKEILIFLKGDFMKDFVRGMFLLRD